jgi:hypothetical protein
MNRQHRKTSARKAVYYYCGVKNKTNTNNGYQLWRQPAFLPDKVIDKKLSTH